MNVNYAVRVEGRACKKGVEAYAEAWMKFGGKPRGRFLMNGLTICKKISLSTKNKI